MTKKGKSGWFNDPYRHALSSYGIPTKNMTEVEAKGILEGEPTAEDIGKMSQTDLEIDAETRKDKAKDLEKSAKEKEKEAKELQKEAGTDWWSKFKSGVGSAIDWGKDRKKEFGALKEKFANKEDEDMGSIIGDDIKNSMSKSIQSHIGQDVDRANPDYTEEDIRDIVKNGTPAELLRAIQTGDVIDADAIEISDENSQELIKHIADLKHDAEMAKEMYERFEDKHKEMRRYNKNKLDNYSDELQDEWNRVKGSMTDQQKSETANEFKHKKNMKKIELQNKVSEHKADMEYAHDVAKALSEIYKERKKFVKRLIK